MINQSAAAIDLSDQLCDHKQVTTIAFPFSSPQRKFDEPCPVCFDNMELPNCQISVITGSKVQYWK